MPTSAEPAAQAENTSTISLAALEGAIEAEGGPAPSLTSHEAPLEALPPGSALLVVKRGPNAGSRFLLDADVTTAGRHPESDIFLDDVTVSRRHAEFARDGSTFVVRDVGSLNGTYLNRERIDAAALAGGDEVQIGKYRLVFLVGARGGEA
jgi:pSer/pThr/pTyr-binding forkhead associated (FHA) protein